MGISKELEAIEKNAEPKRVRRAMLVTDEFLAEQVWNRVDPPQYLVKHFADGAIEYQSSIDLGELDPHSRPIVYVPVDTPALRKGLVLLPNKPTPTTFTEVLQRIDQFAERCYDPVGQRAMAQFLCRVVVGSWFLDRFVDHPQFDVAGAGKFAPIIPIRGPSQSGKNRLAFVLRLLSYRPYFQMSTYRVPSIYRPLDVWQGSLVLDEADFANTNEKSELIHFLNCRATGTPISRQDSLNPKQTHVFANFGQTILTQRRAFDDNATESRCLPFYSEVTDKRLPTVETDEMLREGLEIQNQLFYLRLEHYRDVRIDKTAWLHGVSDPRLVASILPLLALSRFAPSIRDTIMQTVGALERLKVEQKANSEDGVLVNTLWELGRFALHSAIPGNELYYFQTARFDDEEDAADPDAETVVPLTVGKLAEQFKTTSRNIRRLLNSLNLCGPGLPRTIKVDSKNYRAVFFDPPKLEKRLREFVVDYRSLALYEKLGLPIQGTQGTEVTAKPYSGNSLDRFLNHTPCAGAVPSVPSVPQREQAT